MFKATVFVQYVESVVNPDEEVIKETIQEQGYNTIESLKNGRTFELIVNESSREKVEDLIKDLAESLFVNPSMETYRVEIEEA